MSKIRQQNLPAALLQTKNRRKTPEMGIPDADDEVVAEAVVDVVAVQNAQRTARLRRNEPIPPKQMKVMMI